MAIPGLYTYRLDGITLQCRCFIALGYAAIEKEKGMARFFALMTVALAMVATTVGQTAPAQTAGGGSHVLGLLELPYVQQQLQLTPQQQQQVQQILSSFAQSLQPNYEQLSQLTPQQQQQQLTQLRQQAAQKARETEQQVQKALKPQQYQQLEQIVFNVTAMSMLSTSTFVDQLGLTDQQKQQLQQAYESLQAGMVKLQLDTAAKTLAVLNPQQQEKLRALRDAAMAGQAPQQQGAGSQPAQGAAAPSDPPAPAAGGTGAPRTPPASAPRQ
jgi:hypothetical protein